MGALLLLGLIQSLVYSVAPLTVSGLYIDASHPAIAIIGPILYLVAISLLLVVNSLTYMAVTFGSKGLIAIKGFWLAS
jgi:hypothetical protein